MTDTRRTREVRSDTGEEWRTLGFYHEADAAARVWRLEGSVTGLRTLVRMLDSQASKARGKERPAPLSIGPYDDFYIRVWERPGIDDESIYGTADDLARLSHILAEQIAAAEPVSEVHVGREYAADVEYSLLLIVRDEDFDPVTAVPDIATVDAPAEEVETLPSAMSSPALPFKFHDPDGFATETEGLVRVEGAGLVLEYQTKDAFFGALKGGVKMVTLPLTTVSSIEFKCGVFSTEITIQARDMKSVGDIPTARLGRLRLRFKRSLRDEARRLAGALQEAHSTVR